MEAQSEWEVKLLILIQKKILKNKGLELIADELEEDADNIRGLYEVVKANVGSSAEEIWKIWKAADSQSKIYIRTGGIEK